MNLVICRRLFCVFYILHGGSLKLKHLHKILFHLFYLTVKLEKKKSLGI